VIVSGKIDPHVVDPRRKAVAVRTVGTPKVEYLGPRREIGRLDVTENRAPKTRAGVAELVPEPP
jgi:hypothetical protein